MAPKGALIALAAGAFAIGTSEFVIMGLLPDVAGNLAVSIPQAGLLVTGYALGVVLGATILAVVTAGLPRRPTLIALASLFTVGNLLCALAPSYDLLMAARVDGAEPWYVLGIGSVVAAGLVHPQRRSQAIALMFTGLTLANVLGVPAGRLIGHQLGWRTTFAVVVAIAMIAVAALAVLLPVSHRRLEGESREGVRGAARSSRAAGAVNQRAVLGELVLRLHLHHTDTNGSERLLRRRRCAPILLLFGVGLTVGSTLGGKLGDRQLVPSILLIIAANAGVLTLINQVSATRIPMIGMLFIWGTLAFALVPLLQTLIVQHAAEAPNLASTLNQAAFNLGNAVGAWIGSGPVEHLEAPLADMRGQAFAWALSTLGARGIEATGLAPAARVWRKAQSAMIADNGFPARRCHTHRDHRASRTRESRGSTARTTGRASSDPLNPAWPFASATFREVPVV